MELVHCGLYFAQQVYLFIGACCSAAFSGATVQVPSVVQSSLSNSFEDWAHVDQIYDCLIFILWIWLQSLKNWYILLSTDFLFIVRTLFFQLGAWLFLYWPGQFCCGPNCGGGSVTLLSTCLILCLIDKKGMPHNVLCAWKGICNGACRLVAIAGTTIPVPTHPCKVIVTHLKIGYP